VLTGAHAQQCRPAGSHVLGGPPTLPEATASAVDEIVADDRKSHLRPYSPHKSAAEALLENTKQRSESAAISGRPDCGPFSSCSGGGHD